MFMGPWVYSTINQVPFKTDVELGDSMLWGRGFKEKEHLNDGKNSLLTWPFCMFLLFAESF